MEAAADVPPRDHELAAQPGVVHRRQVRVGEGVGVDLPARADQPACERRGQVAAAQVVHLEVQHARPAEPGQHGPRRGVLGEVAVVEGDDDGPARERGARPPGAQHGGEGGGVESGGPQGAHLRGEPRGRHEQLGVGHPRSRRGDHVVHEDRDRGAAGGGAPERVRAEGEARPARREAPVGRDARLRGRAAGAPARGSAAAAGEHERGEDEPSPHVAPAARSSARSR